MLPVSRSPTDRPPSSPGSSHSRASPPSFLQGQTPQASMDQLAVTCQQAPEPTTTWHDDGPSGGQRVGCNEPSSHARPSPEACSPASPFVLPSTEEDDGRRHKRHADDMVPSDQCRRTLNGEPPTSISSIVRAIFDVAGDSAESSHLVQSVLSEAYPHEENSRAFPLHIRNELYPEGGFGLRIIGRPLGVLTEDVPPWIAPLLASVKGALDAFRTFQGDKELERIVAKSAKILEELLAAIYRKITPEGLPSQRSPTIRQDANEQRAPEPSRAVPVRTAANPQSAPCRLTAEMPVLENLYSDAVREASAGDHPPQPTLESASVKKENQPWAASDRPGPVRADDEAFSGLIEMLNSTTSFTSQYSPPTAARDAPTSLLPTFMLGGHSPSPTARFMDVCQSCDVSNDGPWTRAKSKRAVAVRDSGFCAPKRRRTRPNSRRTSATSDESNASTSAGSASPGMGLSDPTKKAAELAAAIASGSVHESEWPIHSVEDEDVRELLSDLIRNLCGSSEQLSQDALNSLGAAGLATNCNVAGQCGTSEASVAANLNHHGLLPAHNPNVKQEIFPRRNHIDQHEVSELILDILRQLPAGSEQDFPVKRVKMERPTSDQGTQPRQRRQSSRRTAPLTPGEQAALEASVRAVRSSQAIEPAKDNIKGVYWSPASNAWFAQWYEPGSKKQVHRSFQANRHGFERAKELAIAARLDAIASGAASIGRRAKSGVSGISWHAAHNSWRATFRHTSQTRPSVSKSYQKSFSINAYGPEQALRLAIEWREAQARAAKEADMASALAAAAAAGQTLIFPQKHFKTEEETLTDPSNVEPQNSRSVVPMPMPAGETGNNVRSIDKDDVSPYPSTH